MGIKKLVYSGAELIGATIGLEGTKERILILDRRKENLKYLEKIFFCSTENRKR